MFEQLSAAEERYQAINDRLMDPNVVSDPKQYAELMKEYKNLTPIVEKYREYSKAKDDMEEARMMLDESGLDKDFRELIEDQYETSKKAIETISEELKILLIPKDPNDDKNVIVEIRGGAGGDEAALFANSLFRMYSMYAEAQGWKIEVLNANPTELGGYKEISFSINGDGAYSKFKFESGVHRVQRVPETETQGRIHTSTVTVAVLPEVDDVEVEINPKDLQIDTYCSGGAGGQHVNKTESAIRITHLPTGVAERNAQVLINIGDNSANILPGIKAVGRVRDAGNRDTVDGNQRRDSAADIHKTAKRLQMGNSGGDNVPAA